MVIQTMSKEINIKIANTLGAIQILNILDKGSGARRVSGDLLDGNLKFAWLSLVDSANYVLSTDAGRKEFLKVIGTLVGVSILKDVTGFNKILSIGRVNLYV